MRDVNKMFRWGNDLAERTVRRFVEAGSVVEDVTRNDVKGEWLALKSLVSEQ